MMFWSETLETWLMRVPFLQDRESAAKLLTHQYTPDRLESLAGGVVAIYGKLRMGSYSALSSLYSTPV
jgi:hypothetical protein